MIVLDGADDVIVSELVSVEEVDKNVVDSVDTVTVVVGSAVDVLH